MASIISAGTTSGTSLNLSGDTSGVLQLATNGSTTAITIDTSQNVGIGTTSPSQPNGSGLVIYDATLPRVTLRNSTTGTASTDGGGLLMSGNNLFVTNRENGNLIFEAANAAESMRIDSSGNVGIGTSSPSAKLHVAGIIQSESTGKVIQLQQSGEEGYINMTGTSSIIFRNGASFTERMRILSTGNILCLSGGNTSATGTGIAFPATQSASSDANTLDDYEEGTWTPTITRNASNPTITYGTQNGQYVKIGRIVYASCNVSWSANTGGSGVNWFISGLPFTNSNIGAGNYAQGTIQDFSGITFAASRTQFGGYVNTGETRFFLSSGGSAQFTDNITVGASGYMYMSVVYIASA